jgi:hypothetical protein
MTLPKLTAKEKEILHLYYQFRFINSNQIQKFLGHKNKKNVNTWLPNLVNNEYLKRIISPSTFEAKTKPTIYHFGANGVRWLKTQDEFDPEVIRKLARDSDRSEQFRSTCQLIADICLDLKANSNTQIVFDWATETEYVCQDSPFYPFSFILELRPDLLFTKQKNHKTNYYLLNVLTTTLPPYRTRKRVRMYLEFLTEYEWMGYLKNPPEILFVCETKELLIRSKRYVKKLLVEAEEENIHLSFAQKDDVLNDGVTGEVWEEVE